jgi:hypothetical protein
VTNWIAIIAWSLLSFVLGVALGTPSKKQKTETTKPNYVCPCSHAWGMHGEDGCEEEIPRQLWNTRNEKAGKEYVQCTCRRYAGEEPPQAFGLNQPFRMTDE